MHKSLKNIALAGIASLVAVTPALAAAQDPATDAAPADDAAQAAPAEDPRLASLPADKQAAIKAWPPETQTYYWSLTEERQKLFWALSDTDKVKLSQLPAPQRESAWAQIEAQTAPPRA